MYILKLIYSLLFKNKQGYYHRNMMCAGACGLQQKENMLNDKIQE